MRLIALLTLSFISVALHAADTKVLVDFESDADLRGWEFKKKSAALSDQHAAHGAKSLKMAANEYLATFRKQDWSGYDALEMEVFVDGSAPVALSLLVADKAWESANRSYWNRHNSGYNLQPGNNTVSIPVNGLFRGEAGSRNNDIKSNIDPATIVRFDVGFTPKGEVAALYLDHMRLVKESRPDGVLALDFGPPGQVLAPGFTAASWNTVYKKDGATAGLRHPAPSGQARDDTFPTRLYQDYVNVSDNMFIADVPNGKVYVWVVFSDCGYWGGEQAIHRKRWIEAEGTKAWEEDRGDAGATDYLFRFETVEPRPSDKLWDLYMAPIFAPKRFEATVADGALNLIFKTDSWSGGKIAGLIIYPESKKAAGDAFVAEVEARNRAEFEKRAISLPREAKMTPAPTDTALWVGFPAIEDDVCFGDAPGRADGSLARIAAQGQRVSTTFAVRSIQAPPTDAVALTATDLKGPAGTIPAAQLDLRYVHHTLARGFNDIAYNIKPESLRRVEGAKLTLRQNETRQFWITLDVPATAAPGLYKGEVTLAAGALTKTLPLEIEVLGFKLDEPDYLMGFYGTGVPNGLPDRDAKLTALMKVLKENGMNTLSGGPGIPFKGLDGDGKPILDFAACDAYMRAAKAAGFTRELNAYGGPGMVSGLHDGYVIGNTGREWEKKTGKSFDELLKIVWTSVKEHSDKEQWLPIGYGFTDEPRVEKQALEQVELMKAYRRAVPFVKIGGSYSVHWNNDSLEIAIQEIFKTLQWSALNLHTQVDLDKGKELGKEIWIYNQGASRYSFGAYQWAEFKKGIRGRMQWHLLALHGYQFYDLDGREPDTAMINWGRNEILPTMKLHRCREGADDFRFAVTLWNRAEKQKGTPAADKALAWLEEMNAAIPLNKNTRPAGFMSDEAFRAACIEHLKALKP